MSIHFHPKGGKLKFGGIVSADIRRQKSSYSENVKREAVLDYQLEFDYRGICLQGAIVSTTDSVLRVRLAHPYQGEDFVIYNFASAWSGQFIHDDQGSLTKDAIRTAKKLLIGVFKREFRKSQNPNTKNLVDGLNS